MSPTLITVFPALQSTGIATFILTASLLLPGCSSYNSLSADNSLAHPSPVPSPVQAERMLPGITPPITVIRQGRYTLVELTPRPAQRELLLQVISMRLPGTMQTTVGDALQHVLLRSGFTLCAPTPETRQLYALPLPAAHFDLGPMTLHDALTTLVGPAWTLSADEVLRQVCFSLPNSAPAEQAIVTETKP